MSKFIYDFDFKYKVDENGYYHNINAPAVIYDNGDKYWYHHGRQHRTDGPAIEYYNGEVEYWVNGRYYKSLEEGLMEEALK